jgi:hypothetical protein
MGGYQRYNIYLFRRVFSGEREFGDNILVYTRYYEMNRCKVG